MKEQPGTNKILSISLTNLKKQVQTHLSDSQLLFYGMHDANKAQILGKQLIKENQYYAIRFTCVFLNVASL